MGMSFRLPFIVVLDDGIESVVDSSPSCEESGRVLIWDFQCDSCVSGSGRFGLLEYFWVLSSIKYIAPGWSSRLVAHPSRRSYARVHFLQVSRMSSLLDLALPFGGRRDTMTWHLPRLELTNERKHGFGVCASFIGLRHYQTLAQQQLW